MGGTKTSHFLYNQIMKTQYTTNRQYKMFVDALKGISALIREIDPTNPYETLTNETIAKFDSIVDCTIDTFVDKYNSKFIGTKSEIAEMKSLYEFIREMSKYEETVTDDKTNCIGGIIMAHTLISSVYPVKSK